MLTSIIAPTTRGLMFSGGSGDLSDASSADERQKPLAFLVKRSKYTIEYEFVNVTPANLIDGAYALLDERGQKGMFVPRGRESSIGFVERAAQSKEVIRGYDTCINLDNVRIDHAFDTAEGLELYDPEADLQRAPSALYLPKVPSLTMYPPSFFVILRETDNLQLFELPSVSYERGTPEASAVEQENEFYNYITVGKGKNRKRIQAETQTQESIVQTRHTVASLPQKKNAATFASLWDMYDSYQKVEQGDSRVEKDDMVMFQKASDDLLRSSKKLDSMEEMGEAENKTAKSSIEEIMNNPRFHDAVVLTERVLANNVYINQQKMYRGLLQQDPLRLEVTYKYSLEFLWDLHCEETANRPAISSHFNPKDRFILAVGYGKFSYTEVKSGVVCIWCVKNPKKPERLYHFNAPVTSVCFSKVNPNWLAVGFYNGGVIILDITSYKKKIIAESKRETNPCYEPIWTVNWCPVEDTVAEYVMTTCQDGRINRYVATKTNAFLCTSMMRVTQVEGKIKGVFKVRPCAYFDVPILRNPAAICYAKHPELEHVYFVGTDEGCVHKCSTNYVNQHMDVFRAHVGPVYGMQFSPFCKKVFLTCGADWAFRLWVEGIDEPLLTMNCPSAVYGIIWCPINSTIIVSICATSIYLWDIRRKYYVPSSEYKLPASTGILNFAKFSLSGDNLVVGDCEGRIHTFHLMDLPIAPFYQAEVLEDSIRKTLTTRPNLLRQLDKFVKIH